MSEPFTVAEMCEYLNVVLKRGSLIDEMTVVQRYLRYLHKPEFKKDWPNETKESIQRRILKYTRIFRALLAVKEGYSNETVLALSTDPPTAPPPLPPRQPSKLKCEVADNSAPSRQR
jgi:hypothetical protein